MCNHLIIAQTYPGGDNRNDKGHHRQLTLTSASIFSERLTFQGAWGLVSTSEFSRCCWSCSLLLTSVLTGRGYSLIRLPPTPTPLPSSPKRVHLKVLKGVSEQTTRLQFSPPPRQLKAAECSRFSWSPNPHGSRTGHKNGNSPNMGKCSALFPRLRGLNGKSKGNLDSK